VSGTFETLSGQKLSFLREKMPFFVVCCFGKQGDKTVFQTFFLQSTRLNSHDYLHLSTKVFCSVLFARWQFSTMPTHKQVLKSHLFLYLKVIVKAMLSASLLTSPKKQRSPHENLHRASATMNKKNDEGLVTRRGADS
jgi:hypothetical protein